MTIETFKQIGNLGSPLSQEQQKRLLGIEYAKTVQDGQVLGLGSGSTAREVVLAIGKRIANEDIRVIGVPTSTAIAEVAKKVGIELRELGEVQIHRGFDGTDLFDRKRFWLTKGGGRAHELEKEVAEAIEGGWTIVADESKESPGLVGFPIPIAVEPQLWQSVLSELETRYHPRSISLWRSEDGDPNVTDKGSFILDMNLGGEVDDESLEADIEGITGVRCAGVFMTRRQPDEMWIAYKTGYIEKIRRSRNRQDSAL